MSKASAARRLATAAAYGGGGLGVVGGSLYAVLSAQAKIARLRIGNATETPPDPSGIYGFNLTGEPIRLAVLGDSAAAGYGAETPAETFGAFLATGLADVAQAPVFIRAVAAVGTQTSGLPAQIDQALRFRPQVCALIIGVNDVTHKVLPTKSVRDLQDAVETMRSAGTEVVVGTCPDLGTIRPIAPPLRQVARRWSRWLAAAQAIAVVEAGGRAVSLGTILGPEFAAAPSDMFGPDQFHPSPAGYRSCAAAMLPTVAAALGLEAETPEYEPARGEGVYTVAKAAAAAAESTGTEVSRADVAGGDHGPRGRWALLRHRRRHEIPEVGDVIEGDEEYADDRVRTYPDGQEQSADRDTP
jgi:lysophospholipase L1-like esterase